MPRSQLTWRTNRTRLGRALQNPLAKGVDLYLHQQGLDTSTPASNAVFSDDRMFADTMLVSRFMTLPDDQRETCRTLADVIVRPHKAAAEGMAASLPPVPRSPLWPMRNSRFRMGRATR